MINTRTSILEASTAILRDPGGPNLTLASAAAAAGLSKPGLMYHFPTKDALVQGVLEYVAQTWVDRFVARLGRSASEATPRQRILTYIDVTLSAELDLADLAVFFDAHYRETQAHIWAATIGPWVDLPESIAQPERGRLHAARLAADGLWFAATSGVLQPRDGDRRAVVAAITGLVDPKASA
jgi:AcrR family transcriptional regulator